MPTQRVSKRLKIVREREREYEKLETNCILSQEGSIINGLIKLRREREIDKERERGGERELEQDPSLTL